MTATCLKSFLKVFSLLVFSCSIAGTTWSTDSSSRTSSMLVLRNLTPQVNRRTICNSALQSAASRSWTLHQVPRVCVADRRLDPTYTVHAARPPHHVPPQPDTGERCGALQLQRRGCKGPEVPAHVRLSAQSPSEGERCGLC